MEIVNNDDQLIYDQNSVLERLDYDTQLLKTLIDAYIKDLPGSIEEIKDAIDHKDFKKVQIVAHKIKGASATVGVMPLMYIAMSIESICRENRFEQINDLMVEFLKNCAIVMDFFRNSEN